MKSTNGILKVVTTLAAFTILTAVLMATVLSPVGATHQPADKVVAAGSTLQVTGPGSELSILAATMRTSSTTDLLITVSLECSIITNVTTVGNDDQRAYGKVEVWVEIDNQTVGVAEGDNGRVVFCDRAHQQTTSLFDDEDATISSYLQTLTANAFTWIELNLGPGEHELVVKSTLTETATNHATSSAAIGKRTFVVEPTKMANDASIG